MCILINSLGQIGVVGRMKIRNGEIRINLLHKRALLILRFVAAETLIKIVKRQLTGCSTETLMVDVVYGGKLLEFQIIGVIKLESDLLSGNHLSLKLLNDLKLYYCKTFF